MKHIKLFESFDRYEFGEFKGNYDLLNFHQIQRDIKPSVIDFTQDEEKDISETLKNTKRALITITAAGKCYTFSKIYGDGFVRYNIYSLGDYCYCIIGYSEKHVVSHYEIIDGLDILCEKLKSII